MKTTGQELEREGERGKESVVAGGGAEEKKIQADSLLSAGPDTGPDPRTHEITA